MVVNLFLLSLLKTAGILTFLSKSGARERFYGIYN